VNYWKQYYLQCTLVHKTCHYYFFNSSVKHWPISIILACDIKEKLDAMVYSFSHLSLTLSLHYCVKCRSRSLALDNNEFLPGSVYVSSEIINWIATNAIGNYHYLKSHTCHITSSSFQHVLKMSSCSINASGRGWHHLPTARSVGLT